MASLTSNDPDYYCPRMMAFRGYIGQILFIDFLRANNSVPGYFKTATDYEKFKDKNKECNDLIMCCVMQFIVLQYKVRLAKKLKTIRLFLLNFLAKIRERLRAYRKRICQEVIADDDLEEEQRLRAELAAIETTMPTIEKNILFYLLQNNTPSLNENSQANPTQTEQKHFYAPTNPLNKALNCRGSEKEKHQTKTRFSNIAQTELYNTYSHKKLSMTC